MNRDEDTKFFQTFLVNYQIALRRITDVQALGTMRKSWGKLFDYCFLKFIMCAGGEMQTFSVDVYRELCDSPFVGINLHQAAVFADKCIPYFFPSVCFITPENSKHFLCNAIPIIGAVCRQSIILNECCVSEMM